MGVTAIRGFNDILPGASLVWREIENEAARVFSSYGFSEIRIPVVEKTELFSRSIGETTDIVEKEMYTFSDRRGGSLTLRPEGTASVVRAYIEHRLYALPVARLYYTGPMFRYERPQKGRYRQFYQIGAEVLGDDSPGADAETIEMLMRLFANLGLKGVSLKINSLGCQACRPEYRTRLLAFLRGVADRLCENCRRRIEANPLRALDCKSAHCVEATKGAPSIIDSLCGDCRTHFSGVKDRLGLLGVDYAVDPRMVRGLDYYTRTTFEIIAAGLGAQNSVAAGGRYDRLVEDLGGPPTPCFGFAIGVERLSLILSPERFKAPPLVVFIAMGDEAASSGVEVIRRLRAGGLGVVEDFTPGGLKKRMKRADRTGARFTVILGSDELAEGAVTLKDMETSAQERVPIDGLAGAITSKLQG
ncbi:MAG: histidine--tRNA ligase [Thermodesulfobacteriota bacterium]